MIENDIFGGGGSPDYGGGFMGGGPPQESQGIAGHSADAVLWALHQFDRPRNALATATQHGMSDDPNKTFLGGLASGFAQTSPTVSWGDVAGIEAPKSSDDWGTYLGRGAGRMGLDILGDPLTFAFGPLSRAAGVGKGIKAIGEATGIAQPMKRASDATRTWLAEGPMGYLYQRLPRGVGGYDDIEKVIDKAGFEGSLKPYQEAAASVLEPYTKHLADTGITHADIIAARELGTSDPLVQAGLDILKPLYELADQAFAKGSVARAGLGLDPWEAIQGMGHFPHLLTPDAARTVKATDRAGQSFRMGEAPFSPSVRQPERMITTFENAGKTREVTGKLSDKRTGVTYDPKTDTYTHVATGEQVFPKYKGGGSTFAESKTVLPENAMIENPVAAWLKYGTGKQKQATYMNILGELQNSGALREMGQQGIGKGEMALRVPGFEGQVADKAVAIRLNNLGKQMMDPSTPWMGKPGELLDAMNSTKFMDNLNALQTWWKRTILPLHPGYHAGNIGSNLGMEYQAGLNPLEILMNTFRAGKVQAGKGADVFEGFTNADLRKMLDYNNVMGSGAQYGDLMNQLGYSQAAAGYGGNTRAFAEKIPTDIGKTMGRGVATGAEKFGKVQDWGMKMGGKAEDNAKISVAINWLKKNAPDLGTMSPAAQADAITQASRFAKDAMIDYSALTPLEENLRRFVPFYSWNRGILGRTGQLAINSPERLARMDRMLNEVFTAPSDRDKGVMPDWIKEGAPVSGVLGKAFGQGEKGQKMLQLGRFLPQGNIEQMASRPLDFMWSSVNPFVKAPIEMMMNKDVFKNRPIDELAGGSFAGLINPLIGKSNYTLGSQEKLGTNLPAAWQYLANMMPGGRYLNEASVAADAMGLTDPKVNKKMGGWDAAAWYGTGAKFQEFDYNKALKERKWEDKKMLGKIQSELKYRTKLGDTAGIRFYQNALLEARKSNMEKLQGYMGLGVNSNTGIPEMTKIGTTRIY